MNTYVCCNPQFIVKGFLQSGIPQALNSTIDIGSDIHADPNDENVDSDETEDSEDLDTEDLDTCDEAYYAPEDDIEFLSIDSKHL